MPVQTFTIREIDKELLDFVHTKCKVLDNRTMELGINLHNTYFSSLGEGVTKEEKIAIVTTLMNKYLFTRRTIVWKDYQNYIS